MGIPIFGKNSSGEDRSWNDISREERLFCSHLYHQILSFGGATRFLERFAKLRSPYSGFDNKPDFNTSAYWEVSFEVCFYRDFLKAQGKDVSESNFSQKRTFDLCFFSEKEIIIVEAKAQGGLDKEQIDSLNRDPNDIENLFDEYPMGPSIGRKNVSIVFIAASKYFKSPAFSQEKGLGKMLIKETDNLKMLVSWKQISEEIFPSIFKRADGIYGN